MTLMTPAIHADDPFIGTVYTGSTRGNALSSGKGKSPTDLLIKRSKELYGYTPDEKSDENIEWMLRNGYLKEKRHRRGTRGKGNRVGTFGSLIRERGKSERT